MSLSLSNDSPAWLLQPNALINVVNNQHASLKDLSSFVSVPNFLTFSSALKQALYWRKRLSSSASANTVIFSFLGDKGLILPSIPEVCKALRNVCDMSYAVEIYRAMNSSFIGISFSNNSEADKIRSFFTFFQHSLVIHASPSNALLHHFKLLWLPPLFADSRIHHFLSRHSVNHHFVRDLISIDTDTHTPMNSVYGTLELAPHYDITKIPHLIPLPPPHSGCALLIISGRPSICLKCGASGHIRRHCSSVMCLTCNRSHVPSSTCPPPSIITEFPSSHPWVEEDLIRGSLSPEDADSIISPPEFNRTFDTSPPASPSVITDITFSTSKSLSINPSPLSPESPASMASYTSVLHDPISVAVTPPLAIKHITRSMSSAKRALTTNVLSSPSPPSNIRAPNLYEHLIDEASSISHQISSHVASASTLLSLASPLDLDALTVMSPAVRVSLASSQDIASSVTALSPSLLPLESSPFLTSSLPSGSTPEHHTVSLPSSPSTPSFKRAKRSSSNASLNSEMLSDGSTSSLVDSWADQVPTELDVAVDSFTQPPASLGLSTQSSPPALFPHIDNHVPSHVVSLSASSDSTKHSSSLDSPLSLSSTSHIAHQPVPFDDPVQHVTMKGLPHQSALSFVPPTPKSELAMIYQSSFIAYIIPHDNIQSSCRIKCLKCSDISDSQFPLRHTITCPKCRSVLTSLENRRFYPNSEDATIAICLSSYDVTQYNIMDYLSYLKWSKVCFDFY